VPKERRGDYFAQIAACRLGVRRLGEVKAAHGDAAVLLAGDEAAYINGHILNVDGGFDASGMLFELERP
jgi:NAD(P)-dependent dehydrogenase (short-subunit alcohol dehydrogenase family)